MAIARTATSVSTAAARPRRAVGWAEPLAATSGVNKKILAADLPQYALLRGKRPLWADLRWHAPDLKKATPPATTMRQTARKMPVAL